MGNWIDTVAVTIIAIGGLVIFYKALKEPIDLLFGVIKNGIESIKDKIQNTKEDAVETITYGG